jgi:hypothetical protein
MAPSLLFAFQPLACGFAIDELAGRYSALITSA